MTPYALPHFLGPSLSCIVVVLVVPKVLLDGGFGCPVACAAVEQKFLKPVVNLRGNISMVTDALRPNMYTLWYTFTRLSISWCSNLTPSLRYQIPVKRAFLCNNWLAFTCFQDVMQTYKDSIPLPC